MLTKTEPVLTPQRRLENGKGRGPKPALQGTALLLLSLTTHMLTLGFTVVAARLLSPPNYGTFMALFGLWSLAVTPSVSVQLMAARHLAKPLGQGFRNQVVRLGVYVLALTSLPLAGVAWLLADGLELNRWPTITLVLQAWWLGAGVAWLRGRAQARNLLLRFGLSSVVEAAVRLAVLAVMLSLFGSNEAWSLLISLGLSGLAVTLVLPGRLLPTDTAPLRLKGLLSSFGSAFTTTLAIGLLANLDLLWARYALTETQAGLFSAGALASRPFILFGMVAGTVVLSNLASGAYTHKTVLRLLGLLSGGGILVAGVAQLVAEPVLLFFFGTEYVGATQTARLAAWGGVLLAPSIFLVHAFLGVGYQRLAGGFAVMVLGLAALTLALARDGATYWALVSLVSGSFALLGTLALVWNHPAER